MSSIATLGELVLSGSLDGTVRAWELKSGEQRTFAAHPAGVRAVAAGLVNGVNTAVSGGNDNIIQVWDLHSGVGRRLEGHTGTVRGVAIGTLDGKSIIISGGDDGTIRIWGDVTADHVEWLSDSPADHDLLVRRPLARSIAARLRRMNDDEPGTSFLVHIDGPWGTGKSTLMRFLQKELEPNFTAVHFNAWSEAGVGPAWWALLTSLRTSVGKQRRWPGRMWLRLREAFARLRRVGAPFVLAFIGLLLVAGGIWWVVNPSFARAQDIFKSAAGILAMAGTVGAGALVASRFLLWDSARGAKLFEQHNTNPMLEVTRHFGWLMSRSKKPVVFFIDDLDKLSTPAAVAATEHSLQRFAPLLPPNPRTMKRFVNAYSAMRAVRTLEGNPVGVESLARWTIIEIRWPGLADHLRQRPESIGLVGTEDLKTVPEELRVLFGDAALRLIVQPEFTAEVIRACCGAPVAVTDR